MKNKFTILGCGSSLGVPWINGNYGKCNPKNNKNIRSRCCAHIQFNDLSILIDTSPDLRLQIIKNNIKNLDYVFYTHAHADQTHGINDLRAFYITSRKKINIYADEYTSNQLKKTFKYCFKSTFEYPAILKMNKLKKNFTFISKNKKLLIQPIMTEHGNIKTASYLINKKIFYGSDVSKIYNKDLKKITNIDLFIIDCLRHDYHPSHYNLETVLKIIKIIKPKKSILTNLHNSLDYSRLKKQLPNNVEPAYDGMSFLIK